MNVISPIHTDNTGITHSTEHACFVSGQVYGQYTQNINNQSRRCHSSSPDYFTFDLCNQNKAVSKMFVKLAMSWKLGIGYSMPSSG